jgi:hypothetical protein
MGDAGSSLIVIKGGSISFDPSIFNKNPHDPQVYTNPGRQIRQIVVESLDGSVLFNSGDHPEGMPASIIVAYT